MVAQEETGGTGGSEEGYCCQPAEKIEIEENPVFVYKDVEESVGRKSLPLQHLEQQNCPMSPGAT